MVGVIDNKIAETPAETVVARRKEFPYDLMRVAEIPVTLRENG